VLQHGYTVADISIYFLRSTVSRPFTGVLLGGTEAGGPWNGPDNSIVIRLANPA
jgi:hypothetical protein